MIFSIYILIAFISGTLLFRHAKDTSFDGDETGWISSGSHYTDLVLAHDFDHQKWECPSCLSFGHLTTHLGQVLIGLPLIIHANSTGQRFDSHYAWTKSYQKNVEEHRVPTQDILMIGRYTSTAFGVAICVLMLAVGHLSRGIFSGILSSALLLMNNLFQESITRAMTDSFFNFFLLAFCFLGIFYIRRSNEPRTSWIAFGLGVLCALSYSVKIHGAIIGSFLFLLFASYRWSCNLASLRRCMLDCAIYSAGLLLIMYLLNPLSWPDVKHIKTVNRLAVPFTLFEEWRQFVEQDADSPAEIAAWQGSRIGTIHSLLAQRYRSFPGDWLLSSLGFGLLGYRCWRSIQTRLPDNSFVPFAYFAIHYFFLLIFLTLNWDRYYLSIVIAQQFITSYGMASVGTWLLAFKKRSARPIVSME